MKCILVCDDDAGFIEIISYLSGMYQGKLEIEIAMSLPELLEQGAKGKKFDAIFLDGILGNHTSTPFVERLALGEYPHLKGAHLYLMSSHGDLRTLQAKLAKDIGHTLWDKGNVSEKIMELASA